MLLTCAIYATPTSAQGFPDQGFDNGSPVVTTDFESTNEGTSVNPLALSGCLFPAASNSCFSGPTVFQQSNSFRQNFLAWACFGPLGLCNHWTLILNNEDAFKTVNDDPPINTGAPLNPGPPDASLPRSLPGSGIFGFATLYGAANFPGDTIWRAHLVLNVSSSFPNPTSQKVPYMAIGAWNGLGAPSHVGVINPSSPSKFTTVQFGERLWDFVPTSHWAISGYENQPLVVDSYVVITALWGSRPKSIQIELFHWSDPAHSYYDLAGWYAWNWNWPVVESVYYPGARFAMIDAEDLQAKCGMAVPRLMWADQEADYSIDADALFHCAAQATFTDPLNPNSPSADVFDEPLPATLDIPIIAVSWATEASGRDGDIWVDVHGMKMVPHVAGGMGTVGYNRIRESHPAATGTATKRVRARLSAVCSESSDCLRAARRSAARDPSLYVHDGDHDTRPTGKATLYYWRSGASPATASRVAQSPL